MATNHVDAYFEGMSNKRIDQAAQHLADTVVLFSPVFPEPFEGKRSVSKVLAGLLDTIDSLTPDLTIASGQDVGVVFTIKCDDITIQGVEHLHVDTEGLIDRFEVAWRPIEAAVRLQEKLARKLGGQPLRLVPA